MPDDVVSPVEDKGTKDEGGQELSLGVSKAGGTAEREWMKDLPDSLKGAKSLSKFADKAALAKSYVELEGLIGRSVQIPGQDATADDWGKFFSRIGRPESTEGYEVPAGKLDKALEDTVRSSAFKAGLNKAQAKMMAEALASYNEQSQAARALAREQAEAIQQRALEERFGSNLQFVLGKANKVFSSVVPKSLAEAIAHSGKSNDPEIINFFAQLADDLGEDKLVPGVAAQKKEGPYEWMRKEFGRGR